MNDLPDDHFSSFKYYDDDGNEMNPDLVRKPALCVSCAKDEEPGEQQVLCNLNRLDQRDDSEFKCHAFEPKVRK
jgi:hypothetical protein